MIEFTYLKQPPNRYTFKQPKLKKWVEKQCYGKVLNLFAGEVVLNVNELRVDVDENMVAHIHQDAYEFVRNWHTLFPNLKFDTIVLDPPYNLRKAREKYDSRYIGSFTKIKNHLNNIISKSGRIVTLGYDSVGMATTRGYEKTAICLICHSGDHNDTIVVVEDRITK